MSSGFSGTGHDFYNAGSFTGRSMATNTPQNLYTAGIFADPASQIHQRRNDFIGKRSLAEFQTQHQVQQQHQQNHLYQQQQQLQQQQALGLYLRNIKQRTNFQHPSPISPLSPVDFSASISADASSISSNNSSDSSRYGLPIPIPIPPRPFQQQPILLGNGIHNQNHPRFLNNPNFSGPSYPKFAVKLESDKNKHMMNRLQELEKQLLDDDDDDENDAVQGGGGDGGDAVSSVVTNSEWSETIQNLIAKPISPSPTSSSSSCSSSSAFPPISCPKTALIEAATAISEGKAEAAAEILTRLGHVSNARGTSEQRLTAYMASALKSRVNPTEFPPPSVTELYGKDHVGSTQLLYEKSPCFKLGFMAANLAILEATSDQQQQNCKLHVVDFDIGIGGQYVHLIHALAARAAADNIPVSLRITTFADFGNGNEERLKLVGEGLKSLAKNNGIACEFNVLSVKATDLSKERLGVEEGEVLAVNMAFRLYKLPDESVTTENLRDELLRRVKGLGPAVVTVVEQEMNGNTAPFLTRVAEAHAYYGALFDSLEATMTRGDSDNSDRVRIEEGLGRRAANSIACEGRDRVERCEVFGKWRARMGMAGFTPKPLSQTVADSLRVRLNSSNPGFTVKEETGGIYFGWMGRTLSVASAWR